MAERFEFEKIKALFFEIYSAGFEAGYKQDADIASAYNLYFEENIEPLLKEYK